MNKKNEVGNKLETIYEKIPLFNIPWNIETPPVALTELVEKKIITPCKTLDIGCGFGNYALYFSGLGHEVTGIDISETAIKKAQENAKRKNIACKFVVADILGSLSEITETFDFIFDWSLLHHIFPEHRRRYAENVDSLLNLGGRYLSVSFSDKDLAFGGKGKYRETSLGTTLYFSSEEEIAAFCALHFRMLTLKTIEIEGHPTPHKAIYAFMTK